MKHMLICMRLADMKRVHPQMVTDICSMCGQTVGIYPSGQRVMKSAEVDIVCHICRPESDLTILAPGAIEERSQSVKRQ